MKTLKLPARGMNLEATLFCGQTFSWRPLASGGFAGVAGRRAVQVRQEGDTLALQNRDGGDVSGEDGQFWHNYFALDIDYAALQEDFCRDDMLARCVKASPGIRVLRQPFFETLLSFIVSQNNNIPRISGIVGRLCQGFGERLYESEYAFPLPAALAAAPPKALEALHAGYRDRYIRDAAQRVDSGLLSGQALRAMPTKDARKALLEVNGVGPKVADCVLLFSLGRWAAAPVDVWMKRALTRYFGGEIPECAGGYQGIAQQYIFAWARENMRPD